MLYNQVLSSEQSCQVAFDLLVHVPVALMNIVYTKKEADGALELFLDKEKICQIKNEKDFLKGYQHGIYA